MVNNSIEVNSHYCYLQKLNDMHKCFIWMGWGTGLGEIDDKELILWNSLGKKIRILMYMVTKKWKKDLSVSV